MSELTDPEDRIKALEAQVWDLEEDIRLLEARVDMLHQQLIELRLAEA